MKARRRQNAIANLNAVSKAAKPIRSAARWQDATGLREPENFCPHSEVRKKLQPRIGARV
uniref:Uncharacterized protein n=1 Tax=Ackermannviridae sp. TaxID=2831612 RepID=A0A8S5VPZ8_9CAUD|nr:MAG TPA: hypothetical protein [Ackermannviridae sp.]